MMHFPDFTGSRVIERKAIQEAAMVTDADIIFWAPVRLAAALGVKAYPGQKK